MTRPSRWLANKTPENFLSWIAEPGSSIRVAVERGNILAVGAVTDAGNITLNYVSPDARFRGVSRGLLAALESRAVERGNSRCTLTSTETARRFYLANDYAEEGRLSGNSGPVQGIQCPSRSCRTRTSRFRVASLFASQRPAVVVRRACLPSSGSTCRLWKNLSPSRNRLSASPSTP